MSTKMKLHIWKQVYTKRYIILTISTPLDAETALKITQISHRDEEGDLKTERRGLKLDLKEMELSHEDYLKSLKQVGALNP